MRLFWQGASEFLECLKTSLRAISLDDICPNSQLKADVELSVYVVYSSFLNSQLWRKEVISIMSSMSNNSSKVEQRLRTTGFKVMLGFTFIISAIIVITEPNNPLIAWVITFTWFILATIALIRPKYNHWCAKSWVLISVPLAPILILSNGLIPATLISLGTIFPVMLVKHYWRLSAVIIFASSTLLVPFADLPYDNAIWLRLSISNAIVAIMVLALVSFLEQALVVSLDKSDEMKKALIREREANLTQSKFLATMSHEIRTPMNGILGLLDVMLSADLSEQQRSHLEKIKYSGDVLHRVLNDILDFSKLTAGKLIIENVPISIHQLITDISVIFQSEAQLKGIDLTFHVDDNVKPSLIGDSTRITQVLNNLVNNAIKFTAIGKVNITVVVSHQTKTIQTLQFCISDTGIGIRNDNKESVFSAFTQADDSTARRFGGTGLGLKIAKNLVEQMGGQIWVNSVEQEGSQFFFTLSLRISAEYPINKKTVQHTRTQFTGNVLVAEDNEINQVVAEKILLSYGLQVDIASDGQQCIDALEHTHYDLVFMDLHMPNVDGFEACSIIRQTDPDIPIVALTAAVLKDEVQKALDAGMNSHLSKPLDHVKLTNILNRYLIITKI
ncbi:MAG: signal transduction histidine kinase/CheY-like chemotaxis protein [Paraglaciecola sp.]